MSGTVAVPLGPIWSLTLMRPWAWCVVGFKAGDFQEDPKRIENRSYPPPQGIETGLLVLHAGKSVDSASVPWLSRELGTLIPDTGTGIVGICRCTGYVTRSTDFWFSGPFGWKLADIAPVREPLRMRGHLGCHRVPMALSRAVRGLYMQAAESGQIIP